MSSKSAVAEQKKIQKQVAKADKKRRKQEGKGAMQAGARRYPEPPMPKQHQAKPGKESELHPPPMYDAPYYKGSDKPALIRPRTVTVPSIQRSGKHVGPVI